MVSPLSLAQSILTFTDWFSSTFFRLMIFVTYIRLNDPYLVLNHFVLETSDWPYIHEIMITRKCISFKSKSPFALSPTSKGLVVQKRCLSTYRPLSAYSDTVSNLRIGEHTRVIFQGFTGRQVNLVLILFDPEHHLK